MSRLPLSLVILISFFMLIKSTPSWASDAASRFFAQGGIGQSVTLASSNKISVTEAPFAAGFAIDQFWSDSIFIYGEHLRSLGTSGTSVGLTGFGFKYYPWLTPQHLKMGLNESNNQLVNMSGYAFFVAGSFGVGQSSVPALGSYPAAIAVSTYLGGKAGVEFPLSKRLGLCGEGNFAHSLAGTGTIELFSFTAGFYFEL